MSFLKEKVTIKKTWGEFFLEVIFSAIFWPIVLYICLSNPSINDSIKMIFEIVSTGKISALKITLILWPAIVIIILTCKYAGMFAYKNRK